MNKKELSRYYYLTLEIKSLEEKIQEANDELLSSRELTGMPHGTGISNPVEKKVIVLLKLKGQLERRKEEAMNEKLRIEEYISSIEDIETRIIFNKRYLELKKWHQIARELYMSERGVYKRHSDYLKRSVK